MKIRCAWAVAVIFVFALSAHAAQKASLIDTAVVLPSEVITGDRISATMVTNPKDFAGLPGLRLVPAQLPAPAGSTPTDALRQFVVQAGNGPAQAADQPFSFVVTGDLILQVRPMHGPADAGVRIPVSFTVPSNPIIRPEGFRIPPISLPGSMQTVRGPFSGDATQTAITANGTPARILAESPYTLYYTVPPAAAAGVSEIVINDHGRRTRLKTWNVALQMSADRLQLKRGESTAYHVFVRGVETIPREAWFGSGAVPELVDPAQVQKFLPGFTPPSSVDSGVLILTIENMSPAGVSITGGDRFALTFRYGQAKYEHHGTIVAKQAGGFSINGTLIPFLHDQAGEGMPGDHVPSGAPADTAAALRERAREFRGLAVDVRQAGGGGNNGPRKAGEDAVTNYQRAGDRLDQSAYQLEDNAVRQADQKLQDQLRESARFWREEAERSRRWAREATDDRMRKFWEDEAQWDEANARRREELTGGKTPGTVAKADPPPPIVPTTPQTPPPTASTPPVTPTPAQPVSTSKKKREEDCPQRGMGCVALVIDFSSNVSWEFDMKSISGKLQAVGCETDYVTPDLQEIPLPYPIGIEGVASYTVQPDPEDQRKAREHNDPEWRKVREAISSHRAKVAKGVELAIEIVNGHGFSKSASSTLACGAWVWKEYTGDYLYRSSFHEDNYHAANKNVCGWCTSDFSCYGGLTPKVVDELENLTTSTCSAASTIACGNHAGWEADASMSSASSTETCSNGSIGWQGGYIRDALDKETERRKELGVGSKGSYAELIQALHSGATASATSRYGDRGYAKDKPPIHARGGYGECSGAT